MPLSSRDWRDTFTAPRIMLTLLVTSGMIAGSSCSILFVAAELKMRFAAGPQAIAKVLLAVYGGAGVLGALVSTAVIQRLRAQRTVGVFLCFVTIGLLVWYAGGQPSRNCCGGIVPVGTGVRTVGVRAAGAKAPSPPSRGWPRRRSRALNTSFLYPGQGIGAALGGAMLRAEHGRQLGLVAAALVAASLAGSVLIARRLRT